MAEEQVLDRGWRSIWGMILLVMVVFSALSLFSYSWTDVGLLKARAAQPPDNLIGPVGAWMSFLLFMTFGVGAYLMPVWFLVVGLVLVLNREERVWPKVLWCTVMFLAVVLMQELYQSLWATRREELNLGEFTTGVTGWLLMQGMLVKWLSPVGAGIMVWAVFALSLVMFAGPRAIVTGGQWTWRGVGTLMGRAKNFKSEPPDKQELIEQEEKRLEKERRRLEKSLRRQQKRQDKEKPEVRRAVIEEKPAQPAPPPVKAGKAVQPKPKPTKREEPVEPDSEEVSVPSFSSDYQLPPVSLLNPIPQAGSRGIEADSGTTGQILIATLSEFGIEAEVTNVEKGPVVTRYELLPAPGIRVEKISGLSNNIALALKATSVRVQAPVPGKGVVGIEVPNAIANMVYLRELLEGETWASGKAKLPLALGKDVGGNDIIADLADMPHLLVAGATGAGKTVCMNSILTGLLMSKSPEELRMMLVDPKIVEFSGYNHLPHLVVPVITNPKKVALGLRWAINEMEKRYKLFARTGVRNIESYNHRVIAKQEDLFGATAADEKKKDETPERVPYIIIVIDELADLMLVDQAEIENNIARLAQLSRAVGIHMILSTQRPSVNVITGTIKANFPARIAFQVAQKVDSRTILDTVGADKLLGRGDMLFLPPGTSKIARAQGAMCSDEEIHKVVEFIKAQGEPQYETEIQEKIEKTGGRMELDSGEDDELLNQAVEIIRETRRASTSSLQRRMRIGYTRAARMMDILEERGIVGPPRGSDPREILIDLDGEIPDNSETPDADAEEDNGVADEPTE